MGNQLNQRREKATINDILPTEILEKVFQILPTRELKAVVQVCHRWREVGESRRLWPGYHIRVNEGNLAFISNILNCRRLQTVKKLDITVKLNGLSSEELEMLLKVCTQLEELNLVHTELTSHIITKVLKVQGEGSLLKKLNLGYNNLSQVDQEALAQVSKQLEGMNLQSTSLTPLHVTVLCKTLAEGTHLKSLNLALNYGSMKPVKPEHLAKGINKLEDADLRNCHLTADQVTALFTAMGGGTLLKKLILKNISMTSSVDPALLVKALVQLEEVDLSGCFLTLQQSTSLCTALAAGTPLKILDLSYNNNISSVEPLLLARAIIQLEEVNLEETKLTHDHGEAIFGAIGGPCKLKRLYIHSNNLSSVDPEVMGKAVNTLEIANMEFTNLTKQQMEDILRHSLVVTSLKEINLRMNGTAIDPNLVAMARREGITKFKL